MKKIYILLITAVVFFGSLTAQNIDNQDIVDIVFAQKTEIYFTFEQPSNEVLYQLGKIVSIDNVKNGQVIAVANKKEFALFLEYHIEYTILPAPWELLSPEDLRMTDNMADKSTYAWDAYPTYQAYVDMMVDFATTYPSLCRLDTIGYSVEGRILLAAVISDNVHTDEDEPEFLYTSTMHGDEVTGYVLMLRLIDYLLVNYGSITDVTNLVNNAEIYINPNGNPDGTYAGGDNSVAGATRSNANNYDLNRNYPVPNGSQYPNGTRQLETQHFMNWAQERDFVMAANFHGGAELMNYPWDYTLTNHPDKNWWIMVSTEYATSAQNNSPSGYFEDYCSGPPSCNASFDSPGVTEGASWYIVDGSRQDYMQYYAYCREVTNEISATKMPAASTLPNFWNYNYQALILYMKQALYGFRGIVTDDCTGFPMIASIELTGHDAQNSQVYSSLPIGNYHRPVKAGTYTIRASAPGYVSQEYTNVTIADYATIIRNFSLMPAPPVVQFTASKVYTCDGIVEFINSSTVPQDVVYSWDFGDGTTSGDENPVHTYTSNGIYTVKLVASGCSGADSLIRTSYIEVAIPSPPVAADQSRCGQGTLTFSATGTGTIYWWDETGNTLLETGTSYTTPLLTQTTDYLVSSLESAPPCFGGKADTVGPGGAFFNASAEHGLVFNALKPITIKSAEMYSSVAGNRTFRVVDSGNNQLATVIVNVPLGHSTVQLDLTVPVGTGHKLLGPASAQNLYRNNVSPNNIGYPFDICDMMTITGSTAGTNPTSYYYYFYNIEVEEQPVVYGGQTNQTANGGYYTLSNQHGLYFDCTEEVTLKSVKVYSNSAGNRTISLLDASDNPIESASFTIPNGESRVELNFTVPAQTGLKLMGPVSPGLWRDGGTTAPDLPYPYAVGDVISITGNSANNVKYYYYFYDWEVEKPVGCESPKVPVTGYIYSTPVADFSWIENSFVVTFTNESTGGGTYLWDFGDGQTSTEANPVHTYASGGSYIVTLTITNDCDTDVYTEQIAISTVSVYTPDIHIEVFPNPAKDIMLVKADGIILKTEVFDLQGKLLLSEITNNDRVEINVEILNSGTYILKVTTGHGTIPCMFVKQ
jgi:PKD repeat protein